MASDGNGEQNQTATREKLIAEALDSKRRILDEEIHAFRNVKDQEFRAFEAYLRKSPGEASVANAEAHVESLGLRYKIKKPKIMKGFAAVAGHRKHTDENTWNNGHEREREFQGVITPSYLPLLGGERVPKEKEYEAPTRLPESLALKENKEEKAIEQERTSKMAQERDQMKLEIAAARRTATLTLSSSAEYQLPAMISPPATSSRPLSSSVPPEHQNDLNQRRSSSRSDLSIDGLRSSIKDPSQPRSPKRVQFSIDNTVVSPSTSPLVSRSSATSASDNPERFEVVKGKREGKSSSNGPLNNGTGSSSSGPILNGSLVGMTSFGSYFKAKHDNNALSSTSAGGDDFDVLDNEDDVFTFDEDIGSRPSAQTGENDKSGMFNDIEEGAGGEPPLTGSSPHAGSLPIEIKMPSRRARGAEDG